MSGSVDPRVLVCGTGMVRLPAASGGAVESYVHDILEMFDAPAGDRAASPIRAVSDWAPGYRFADQCVPVHSPVDRYPLPPYVSAVAHGIGGVLTARAVLKEVRRNPPDLLHLNEEATIRLCRRLPTTKILTLHSPSEFLVHLSHSAGPSNGDAQHDGPLNTLLRRLDWGIVREALGSYDGVIVLTSFAQRMLAKLGVDSTLIPLPVNTNRFQPPLDGSGTPRRSLLFVGRLERRKNPCLLLHVLARLPSDVTLVLVGRGPELPAIQALAARLGLADRMTILPSCSPSRLSELYRDAGVFVFPSRIEAYGKVLNEALASGLPIVVPRTGIYDDLLEAGVAFGFTKLEECVDVVQRILDGTELRKALSVRTRQFAVTNLGYDAIRERLAREYGIAPRSRGDFRGPAVEPSPTSDADLLGTPVSSRPPLQPPAYRPVSVARFDGRAWTGLADPSGEGRIPKSVEEPLELRTGSEVPEMQGERGPSVDLIERRSVLPGGRP